MLIGSDCVAGEENNGKEELASGRCHMPGPTLPLHGPLPLLRFPSYILRPKFAFFISHLHSFSLAVHNINFASWHPSGSLSPCISKKNPNNIYLFTLSIDPATISFSSISLPLVCP